MGSWSQILAWSYLAIHAAHLSDGTIILWNYGHADGTTPEVRLYDPRIGQIIDPNLGPTAVLGKVNEQNPSDVQLVPSIGKYVKVVGPIIN